jgi:hypothetical protein
MINQENRFIKFNLSVTVSSELSPKTVVRLWSIRSDLESKTLELESKSFKKKKKKKGYCASIPSFYIMVLCPGIDIAHQSIPLYPVNAFAVWIFKPVVLTQNGIHI